MMERNTRAMGKISTAERKRVQPTTKRPDGEQSRGRPDGSVQKGKPVGAMTTQNEKATIPDGK